MVDVKCASCNNRVLERDPGPGGRRALVAHGGGKEIAKSEAVLSAQLLMMLCQSHSHERMHFCRPKKA